ncbi:hypothetical protein ABK040_014775 [Willaertia magna]
MLNKFHKKASKAFGVVSSAPLARRVLSRNNFLIKNKFNSLFLLNNNTFLSNNEIKCYSTLSKDVFDNETYDPKLILHFGTLTIPLPEKPTSLEDLREFVATGLKLNNNKECIKFFEIDERNKEKQLKGQLKLKKEVTDIGSFQGKALQAVIQVKVLPFSFLQLQDAFPIYLHDVRGAEDFAIALHTYTRKYKYCYVFRIATDDDGTPQREGEISKAGGVKRSTILRMIDENKEIPLVIRSTTVGKIYKASQFALKKGMEKFTLIEEFEAKIASLVSYGEYLWIGGNDGRLYMYTIEPIHKENQAPKYSTTLLKKKVIAMKKAILNLQVDPPHKKLFALIDQTVSVYDMTTLTHLGTLEGTRGTTCYAINKNFSHELVAIVKKKMMIFDYREQTELVREMKLPTNENVTSIEWMKKTICIGFPKKHIMINYQTGEIDEDLQKLQLTNIVSDEYSIYGCFVKIIGISSNIQWKESISSVSICFPFLIGISKSSIEIYNMYEKRFTEPIENKKAILTSDHIQRVFLANNHSIYALTPKPIDQQISDLIGRMRLLEAFGLFEKTFQGTKKEKERKLFYYEQQAGFACFFRTRFKEAFAHFNKSKIDPREVLWYFKDLLEPESNFIPQQSKGDLQEKIKSAMEQEGEKDTSAIKIEVRIKNAKKALQEFLEKARKMRIDEFTHDQLSAIDYALAKLYLNEFKKYGELKTLIRAENHINIESGEVLFRNNARYLAFLYYSKNQTRKALETLKALGAGDLKETSTNTNGVEESIEILSELDDEDLVLEFCEWVFDEDETSAINIFISKLRKKRFNPDRILSFLYCYPPDLERTYLEYLVAVERNQEERIHTQLIINYIETTVILKPTKYLPFGVRVDAGKENGVLGEVRGRLIFMLEHTNIYNKYLILSKLQKTSLYEETLIIYRKLQNHEAALKLLVHKIQDLEWAERYCVYCYETILEEKRKKEEEEIQDMIKQKGVQQIMDTDKSEKRIYRKNEDLEELNPLFITLLGICLNPEHGFVRNEPFALYILKTHAKNIDPIKALSLLPDDISVSKVHDFLRQSIQTSKNRDRQAMVIYNMSKIRHVKSKVTLAKGVARRVMISEDSRCAVCDKPIDASAVFVTLPDLTTVHFKCVNKSSINIHPLSGRNFKHFPVDFDEQITESHILNPPYSM